MLKRKQKQLAQEMRVKMPEGLYANMNARKKKGTSRSKKNSTISDRLTKI